MNNLWVLVLILLNLGCDWEMPIPSPAKGPTYRVIIFDECEYVEGHMGSHNGFLAHKGNCIFCAKRNN